MVKYKIIYASGRHTTSTDRSSSRRHNSSRHNSSRHISSRHTSSRHTSARHHSKMMNSEDLRGVAQSTLEELPEVLKFLGRTKDAQISRKFAVHQLRYMNPGLCPAYARPAVIRVLNMDTINAAIQLAKETANNPEAAHEAATPAETRPLIVNFANPQKPGGGWLNGRIAQEEALFYRSSLALSLHPSMYPLRCNEVIYSPYALIIRDDMAHDLSLYLESPSKFPTVSCVTVAALRNPPKHTFTYETSDGTRERTIFSDDEDRINTKIKMRQTLRAAATHKHRLLVLGALGCGVYNNPPEDVAHCWLEVLREHEFVGNWWREVVFAVYDVGDSGNYDIFDRVLSGKQV